MKRTMTILLAAVLCLQLQAQTTSAEAYKARYDRQVKNVGAAGVGVETILNKWAADYPDDGAMLEGKFNYYLAKSQSSSLVVKDMEKYLGNKPVLSLKDSTGRDVNYFEEISYEDSTYAKSASAIDRAIALYPNELGYRVDKVTSLIFYEKESPDMATQELLSLIDYNESEKPEWQYYGLAIDEETFYSTMQEYCYHFFRFAMPQTYEAFRTVTEKLLKYYPKNTDYLNNMGSYWFVAKGEYKKALKYYNKVLKLSPKDYTAIRNCVLIARKTKDVKLEKKYLPLLIETTESEGEKLSGQARLDSFNKKK